MSNENTVIEQKSLTNVQNEICFVGALYKNPDLFVSYGSFIRSQYDFSDEACKFFYDCFELMYKTFSQSVDENKLNIFMSQDLDRLKQYKAYKGWKLIKSWVDLTDDEDIKNYYNTLKKFSLIREYARNDFPAQRLLNSKKFNTMTANEVFKAIRSKCDKINTVINCSEESVLLNTGVEDMVKSFLIIPDMGLTTPWYGITKAIRGLRLGKVLFNGFLSNEGKTRNLMLLASYVTIFHNEKFLLLSNEMDEVDLKKCLIATVLNNKCFQDMHGIHYNKAEEEIVMGIYKDDKGNIISRYTDKQGYYIESELDYINRMIAISDDFRKVQKVSKWVDENTQGKLFFKDVGTNYSDETIEFEIRKHKMIYDCKYFGYDTLKPYRDEQWQIMKQTATKLKELCKEINVFCWAVFQLTDDTVYTDIFEMSSNNIGSAKSIKHVADFMILGKKISKDEYHKYKYLPFDDKGWGKQEYESLAPNKQYFAEKWEKNRGGDKKNYPLFEFDLNYNQWVNIGYIERKL